jgi:hypothetical protein
LFSPIFSRLENIFSRLSNRDVREGVSMVTPDTPSHTPLLFIVTLKPS